MGRLRSQLGQADADRELGRHVAGAQRSLQRAVEVCARVARNRSQDSEVRMESRRARATQRRLAQALVLLGEGGAQMKPPFDHTDPDLVPEGMKFSGWHNITTLKGRRIEFQGDRLFVDGGEYGPLPDPLDGEAIADGQDQ